MAKTRVEVLALMVLLFLCVREIKAYGYDERRPGGEGERMAGGEGERGQGGEGERGPEGEGEGEREMMERGLFLLKKSKRVVKTDAGELRVVKGFSSKGVFGPMHIGFINMEPKSLFIPQYIDASLILFVRRGELRVGMIYKDDFVEKDLKIGDIYRIPAGSAFYLVNNGKGQILQIICSIDPSEGLGLDVFQPFYIAGETYPTPVLAGFDRRTLLTALNVTEDELRKMFTGTNGGPIIFVDSRNQPRKFTTFLQSKQRETQKQDSRDDDEFQHHEEKDQPSKWTWTKLLSSLLGKEEERDEVAVKAPDSYNLYDRKPDFQNEYGWSVALDASDYEPLERSGVGVYLVNLTAGSMMAPHVNPTATEYGVVLKGTGTVQVVFPNGTSAMNVEVAEGDVFWVPRYFPFCQIAARSGAMEFFGFTTSARKNRPQFLVGASSVLRSLNLRVVATAFGTNEKRMERIINAQKHSVILPANPFSPRSEDEGGRGRQGGRLRLNSQMLTDMMF